MALNQATNTTTIRKHLTHSFPGRVIVGATIRSHCVNDHGTNGFWKVVEKDLSSGKLGVDFQIKLSRGGGGGHWSLEVWSVDGGLYM